MAGYEKRTPTAGIVRPDAEVTDVTVEHLQLELLAILGADNLLPSDDAATRKMTPSGWEHRPIAMAIPGSEDDVEKVVQAAESAGVALVPCGGGTRLQTGYPPTESKPWVLLSSARLIRLLDHQPDDLTVTCQPGMTLGALQKILATHHQFLALDTALPDQASLGGIVSSNMTGFRRLAYGAPRDLLIGLRAVMTDGVTVKGGGKVVKNVAGYDVCKLFSGAWGTLGFLTELTFKVRPSPETECALAWRAPDLCAAANLGLRLHHDQIAPTFILATNEPEGETRLVVGLHGTQRRVEWQTLAIQKAVESAGWADPRCTLGDDDVSALRDVQARLSPEIGSAARLSCLPTEMPRIIEQLDAIPNVRLTADIGTGTVNFAVINVEPSHIAAIKALTPRDSNLLWMKLDSSTAEREKIEVWGEKRDHHYLHRAIKQSLDPKNTFSPGRFFDKL